VADLRTCKVCGEAKPFERSTWVWSTRAGCHGTVCKACTALAFKIRAAADRSAINEVSRKSKAKNLGAAIARTRAWHAAHPNYDKEWSAKNPGYYRAKARRRELALIQRTPKWVDPEHAWFIQEAYSLMQLRTAVTGIQWHVDHVVPLHGKHVSGLHVIQNLCVIPARHNLVKGNSYE
jgi:hypothetical protein